MNEKDTAREERTDGTTADRGFGRRAVLGAAGFGLGLSALGLPGVTGTAHGRVVPPEANRLSNALALRHQAANDYLQNASLPNHPDNGDADAYADKRGSYIKGLRLNHGSPDLGLVDLTAWQTLIDALDGSPSIGNDDPTGGPRELVSPQAALRYEMDGYDPHQPTMPPAPTFTSDRMGAEMGEVYWMAVLRDWSFRQYDIYGPSPDPSDAMQDLTNSFSDPPWPTENGSVTPGTLFRADIPGCLTGPYISQLLFKPISYGAITLDRRINEVTTEDFNTTYSRWLDIIEGKAGRGGEFPPRSDSSGISLQANSATTGNQVYIRNGRDLGEYVHINFSYQPYLSAALLVYNDMGAPLDPNMPFIDPGIQTPYVSFGGAGIFDLVANVASHALSAAWFHKWLVHLRLRPETFAGRVHNVEHGNANYSISTDLLDKSSVLGVIADHNGDDGPVQQPPSYLLPMAYPEGSPAHPSYPSGHAVIAGACTTVLKAVFDESHVIEKPVQATADGTALESIAATLTLGDELNKLAANVTLGRNFAGVHYRSDGSEGLRLGEEVAVGYLEYVLRKTREVAPTLTFHDFDGNPRTISP